MKDAIITVAGISSRFNKGIPEDKKQLKAIYTEDERENTLLFRLLKKCAHADRIIIVGGYKYESLQEYCNDLDSEYRGKVTLVYNEHYEDLASGYSLYLGLKEAFSKEPDEILFAEGDLDIDIPSFAKVVSSKHNVLTYTSESIYADKAVVLYRDKEGAYKYAFNSSHGLLTIDEPFSFILNSGQTWKFMDMEALKKANDDFAEHEKGGTNLGIIQRYLDTIPQDDIELIKLDRWTNCNTRTDYMTITKYWRDEN